MRRGRDRTVRGRSGEGIVGGRVAPESVDIEGMVLRGVVGREEGCCNVVRGREAERRSPWEQALL